ncbi:MAG: hypothetical protein M0Z84_05265 [Gammaproteobacteria bacterium]|nr:hypothetical protein [Gammaproteobacteria bacterium]
MNSKVETPVEPIVRDDLQQLVELAHFIASARDAMSDEMVARIARATSEGLNQLDRLTRNEGLMRLLQVINREDSQRLLIALADVLHALSREVAEAPAASGGIGGILGVMREPGTQEGLRLLALVGKHLSHSLRQQHRSNS